MYLRVPHYVGAYFRNKDINRPIPVGGMVKFEGIDVYWHMLTTMLHPNRSNKVVRCGCFCEHQWKQMRKGNAIRLFPGEHKFREKMIQPLQSHTLSDNEVFLLSGNTDNRSNNFGEYLCIRLPQEVVIHGVCHKVTESWQLFNDGANSLCRKMTDEFWRCFMTYVEKDNDWCRMNGVRRTILEQIERFMMRFDIRNSADDHEKMLLKRNYYRRKKNFRFTEEDFIEHGN